MLLTCYYKDDNYLFYMTLTFDTEEKFGYL